MNAFDRIIGYTAEKRELMQIADTLKNREVYRKLGASSPKGLFLYGEPGVGKSLMAGAVIEASGRPAFTCRKDQPDGEFVKTIKATFDKALKAAPSIVFLDDMDKFANEDEDCRDAEEYVTIQSCIDEVKGEEVFVLATANNRRKLPDSLLRAGRFDRILEIEAPHGQDALDIITHYLEGKKFADGIDVKTIARIMDGHSCAELETVLNEAGLYAGFDRADAITMEHFMQACLRNVYDIQSDIAGLCPDSSEFSDGGTETADTVFHEGGHAVISEVLCPGSVTLVYVHGADRGFTTYYNDHSVPALDWDRRRIIASLGGKAALERQGRVCIGCAGDLDQAFNIIHRLVRDMCVCGFRYYSSGFRDDSQSLKEKQEEITAAEMERYYTIAKEILARNEEFYDALVSALRRKSLLTMKDIQEIRSRCRITEISVR